jgi:hypothetical protein
MKTLTTLALAALTISMVACAAEEPTEETGQTEDHYDVACVSNIQAPPGSPQWRAALQQCISGYGAGGGGTVGGGGGGGGGGQSCSVSSQCINGSCTCSGGPNVGRACIGSQVSGADSCSVLCRYCR